MFPLNSPNLPGSPDTWIPWWLSLRRAVFWSLSDGLSGDKTEKTNISLQNEVYSAEKWADQSSDNTAVSYGMQVQMQMLPLWFLNAHLCTVQ